MKLLYLWIEKTEKPCFEHNDFNFSNKYEFSFDFESKTLKVENIDLFNPYDMFSNLESINAIVGPNGSGKTTLLETIMNLACYSIPKIKAQSDPMYLVFSDKEILENSYIAVFQINKEIKVINNTKYKVKFSEHIFLPGEGAGILKNTSRILVTKENNHPSLFMNGDVVEMSYVNEYVNEVGKLFFNSKVPQNNKMNLVTSFYSKKFNFDDILIFDYFSNTSTNLEGILKNSSIQFQNFIGHISHYLNIKENENHKNYYFYKDIFLKTENIQKQFINENNYIDVLKMNFVCEFLLFKPELKFSNSYSLQSAYDFCRNIVFDNNEINLYFKNGVKEIEILEEIKHVTKTNKLPPTDLAYIVKRNYDVKGLKKYFDFICNSKYSFSIKYLMFQPCCSNGELELVKMLSRINLIFNINRYLKSEKRIKLAENVIILFDEIETNMHPDWQRKMIKYILEEFNKKYIDKNIQVIFTTHSPLLLSDMPSCNVNYINYDYKTMKRTSHRFLEKRTFGTNIFDLYRDSFFFDNGIAMGQFAIDYINELTNKIYDGNKNISEKEIELIGDDFIRNQLIKLLNENDIQFTQTSNNNEIVETLKEQRNQIDALIKKYSN